MQKAAPIETLSSQARLEALQGDNESNSESSLLRKKREKEGLKISVWGSNALYFGTTLFFVITIGLSYINADAQINAGLYVTSASGAVCIICALAGYKFLPTPDTKILNKGDSFLMLPFRTCKSGTIQGHILNSNSSIVS
jgi:hypothetical protein